MFESFDSALASHAAAGMLVFVTACASTRVIPVLSPEAQAVRVEKASPPPGARLVGAIEATDGKGCGIGGDLGTAEGATFLLKEAAARQGMDFVKISKVKKPYSGHDCYHQEYTIQGSGYALPKPEPVAPPPPTVTAPPAATPSAEVTASPAPPPPAACVPPCSPGYECHAGVCEALCNPACSAEQMCRSDRVCVPRVGQ